jgi:micrococcal nuclease
MYTYRAHVTKVYDGDTITADVDLGMGVWLRKQKIRLFGLNAPEMRGESRNEGIKSRDFLRKLVLNKEVVLVTYKDSKGKWGRWLGDIFIPNDEGVDICINSVLINKGYAEPYEV